MPPKGYLKVPLKLSRKNNTEKEVAQNLLDNFIAKGSKGEALIEKIIGLKINQISLTGLIQISRLVSELADIKFPRNYKRKKDLIIKWFDDNSSIIDLYRNNIQVVYALNEEKK